MERGGEERAHDDNNSPNETVPKRAFVRGAVAAADELNDDGAATAAATLFPPRDFFHPANYIHTRRASHGTTTKTCKNHIHPGESHGRVTSREKQRAPAAPIRAALFPLPPG